ncbi:prolipoprotein diacylglyceryl transferase [Aminobacterium mobile]|jgi:phosphatidylglycerol:prolipoprotein diacylglycerol transferase|uniref:prolipoprotein diacylglyceryl transferase n=1 Tax=Aminobacterium mobile TaxID=81467 RepID=UPI0033161FC8
MHQVLFHLGSFTVYSYYMLWTVALFVGFLWTYSRSVIRYGLLPHDVIFLLSGAGLGIIAGMSVSIYLKHPGIIWENPLRLFYFGEGGLSSFHAFIGGVLGTLIILWVRKIPLWRVAEASALPASVVLAIGRWGCFLNGCCAGVETSFPWGIRFPIDPNRLLRHPTELYYAFSALAILWILQEVEGRIGALERKHHQAILWPLFCFLYGCSRFLIDPLRIDWFAQRHSFFMSSSFLVITGAVWGVFSIVQMRRP